MRAAVLSPCSREDGSYRPPHAMGGSSASLRSPFSQHIPQLWWDSALIAGFFLALFPVPLTINPLCLCSGHILHGGRRLKLPLWISFLLLSDICISGCGLSEFCSSPLKHLHPFWAWSHHAFHKYILDPLSKASIRMLDRSRCWPELSQASAALGMSHRSPLHVFSIPCSFCLSFSYNLGLSAGLSGPKASII